MQDNLEATESSADGEEHRQFPESRKMKQREEVTSDAWASKGPCATGRIRDFILCPLSSPGNAFNQGAACMHLGPQHS